MIEERFSHARELLQVARAEFEQAEQAPGREAVIWLRNSCGKGWLAALEAVNAFFIKQGVAEEELPDNDRSRRYFARWYMDRDMRRAYNDMRQTFHIDGYYEGIVEFDDMPDHFTELEEFIADVEKAEPPDGVES